ncbi:MAG TPA: peptide chain release factor N(5)-glutamine methyltransferase [Pontiella sp.]|nr:peptide chain release factor N(5)-glutamine methyltransferase [Pontiella sp.]
MGNKDMEISQLVESFEFRFAAAGVDNAKRVAEELLAHVFHCKPLEIYTGAVPAHATAPDKLALIKQLEPMAERIENGEPLQYVIGHVDFWGLELKCDPRALIPRPETELLVEEVLSSRIWERQPAAVVDVGTGTGCIVLTLAKQRSDANFKAVDVSSDALMLARENARLNGLEDAVVWLENFLLDGFAAESTDAVVANLPYIATDDWKALPASVRDYEPQSALESGPSGMEMIALLAAQARSVLVPGGMLFLEFGYDQGREVAECLQHLGYHNIEIKHDLAGHDRIAIAENP